MRIFKVGGWVRDWKRGVQAQDTDYVVTGATEDEFLKARPFGLTFEKVGAAFPVYIGSDGNEWAMARRESKVGVGYHGFEVDFGPEVTIEQDLYRRDLTINAMAVEVFDDMKTRVLEVIDPYGGQEDIHNRILRHTSDAFVEDPVRVLRLARLRARFGPTWTVAPETVALVSQMAKKGVLNELTAERVWKELSRALMEPHPRLFFDTLLETDALHVIFPEVYRLKTALEARRWHPEGDAYEHTMLVLTQAAKWKYDLETRVACLVHDFGKGLTPRDQLPKHYGHEVSGVAVAKSFCDRLTVPAKMRDRVMKTTRYHMTGHKMNELSAKGWFKMFTEMDVLRDEPVVDLLHKVFVCDRRGRLGSENEDVSDLMKVFTKFEQFKSVRFDGVFDKPWPTDANKIKEGIMRARINAMK